MKLRATSLFILLIIGCTTPVVQWQPPLVPEGWFSGLGRGSTCEEARARALKELCESLFVQVSGHTTVRDRQEITGAAGESVRFSQVLDMVARTRTRCTFEGQPYRVTREVTSDGRCHVQLAMSRQAFGRYLHSRTVVVRLGGDVNRLDRGDAHAIGTAVYQYLERAGFLVLEDPDAPAVRAGNVVLHLELHGPSNGLYVARLSMDIRVVRIQGGAVDSARTLRTGLHYGFKPRLAVRACVQEMVKELNKPYKRGK